MENIETDYKAKRAEIIAREKIRVTSVFVPFSQSRNKNEKHKSLNWTVSLWRGGTCAITTDYSAGIGHCPAYKKPPRLPSNARGLDTWARDKLIAFECENGHEGVFGGADSVRLKTPRTPIEPDAESVLHSILVDSDVLDYRSFEDWADCYGYDRDSRSAESIYRDCLKIALQVRAVFGESLISELRDAFQNY